MICYVILQMTPPQISTWCTSSPSQLVLLIFLSNLNHDKLPSLTTAITSPTTRLTLFLPCSSLTCVFTYYLPPTSTFDFFPTFSHTDLNTHTHHSLSVSHTHTHTHTHTYRPGSSLRSLSYNNTYVCWRPGPAYLTRRHLASGWFHASMNDTGTSAIQETHTLTLNTKHTQTNTHLTSFY